MTAVRDYSLLDCRFREASSSVEMDLKIEGTWTLTDGNLDDEISYRSSITDVTARFGPDTGYEHRMRFQPDGGSWGAWSSWTTSRITHDMTVPSPGNSVTDDYEVELRPTGGGTTLSEGGYIKIMKLDSGG
ncbi:MAG: hypothetical protein KDK70_39090 [Myxococcales bacterium]|nr:hypothetical protein [Myxococcales bacterium]